MVGLKLTTLLSLQKLVLKNILFLSLLVSLTWSCTQQSESPKALLPSNLQINIKPSESIEGQVEITAIADNANYYGFEFFEEGASQVIENSEGKVSYQYKTSGTHKIIVRAHTSFKYYVSKEDSISISIEPNNSGFPNTGYTTPLSYPGYTLVWQDEFNENTLSSDWVQETGRGNNGWGNNELQFYRAENTEVRDGALVITARKQDFGGQQYTSSRIKTQGRKSFKYGRIDIRAALPKGKGIWPATWMLGNNFPTAGWPHCGEIDIMEMVGGPSATDGDRTIHGTVHWSNAEGNHTYIGGSNTLNSGIFADNWHVFTILWNEQKIEWYRDDIKYYEINITSPAMSEFHQEFFFIMNVAVGGNWPGSPDGNTQFPQRMAVDYVRVFQRQ